MPPTSNITATFEKVVPDILSSNRVPRIGIYGPANAGKTTLANRISRDWTGSALGPEGAIPHETRHARRKRNVEIEENGSSITVDIVDTPGVESAVDHTEFLEYDMVEEDAIQRSREASDGVGESLHWLRDDIDGVIYVLDSAKQSTDEINMDLMTNIKESGIPILLLANKIDLDEADVEYLANNVPHDEIVPFSALKDVNMDIVYYKMVEYFNHDALST